MNTHNWEFLARLNLDIFSEQDNSDNNYKLLLSQALNALKLEKNDAVYIFDEVGCGKTLSAVMCAAKVWHDKKKEGKSCRILIITPGAVFEGFKNTLHKAFIDKTIIKFKSDLKGNDDGIYLVKYSWQAIEKIADQISKREIPHFDLVILDEAHRIACNSMSQKAEQKNQPDKFDDAVRKDTKTFFYCSEILTEKVVMMTATPYKYDYELDRRNYGLLAYTMTKNSNNSYDKSFDPQLEEFVEYVYNPQSTDELRNALFDMNTSCYMKEIANELCLDSNCSFSDSGVSSNKVHKRNVDLWVKYDFNKKLEKTIMNSTDRDRYVIFVESYDDGDRICSALAKNPELKGKVYFSMGLFDSEIKSEPNGEKQTDEGYIKVKKDELFRFSTTDRESDELPKVLVMTYQMGQEGINLPGFNHVINYSILPSSGSLEQRFGRIDRIDSVFAGEDSLTMIYYCKNAYDKNFLYFLYAVQEYIERKMDIMPTKNVLLNDIVLGILEKNINKSMEECEQHIDDLENLKSQINDHIEIYKNAKKGSKQLDIESNEDDDKIPDEQIDEVIDNTRGELEKINEELRKEGKVQKFYNDMLGKINGILNDKLYSTSNIIYNMGNGKVAIELERVEERVKECVGSVLTKEDITALNERHQSYLKDKNRSDREKIINEISREMNVKAGFLNLTIDLFKRRSFDPNKYAKRVSDLILAIQFIKDFSVNEHECKCIVKDADGKISISSDMMDAIVRVLKNDLNSNQIEQFKKDLNIARNLYEECNANKLECAPFGVERNGNSIKYSIKLSMADNFMDQLKQYMYYCIQNKRKRTGFPFWLKLNDSGKSKMRLLPARAEYHKPYGKNECENIRIKYELEKLGLAVSVFYYMYLFKEKNDIFKDTFIYFGENDDKLFRLFNDIPGHESVPYLKYSEQSDEVKLFIKTYFCSQYFQHPKFKEDEVPAFLLNVNINDGDLINLNYNNNGYLSYLPENCLKEVANCLVWNDDNSFTKNDLNCSFRAYMKEKMGNPINNN